MTQLPSIPKDKEFIKFCNSLRCPLCKSQLDGNIHPKAATLYCSVNNEEYKVQYFPESNIPTHEEINYYYGQFRYEIVIHKFSVNEFKTVVNKIDLDIRKHLQSRVKIFEMFGARLMFFRKRMEEHTFLDKLKLYNVFS
jgi:hypothetical protein